MLIDQPPKIGQWADRAECRGQPTYWWFPDEHRTNVAENNKAKKICQLCPVIAECLEYAMSYPHDYVSLPGIWGGLTEGQRRQLNSDRYWAKLDARM